MPRFGVLARFGLWLVSLGIAWPLWNLALDPPWLGWVATVTVAPMTLLLVTELVRRAEAAFNRRRQGNTR